ncbi:Protein CBG25638 [Caenorhabditis briggsae]|uniref:Protein CBG25638 n=1 Tax=Caenorhabditis briggsae TaxID=6238 RepID=B6IFC2_CAEBR|nr:Protein CBG25638 [Caenorhabditis briggsae]CAR98602.1 Protein CBG25638 [Caenorhabditis briggsae]
MTRGAHEKRGGASKKGGGMRIGGPKSKGGGYYKNKRFYDKSQFKGFLGILQKPYSPSTQSEFLLISVWHGIQKKT